METVRSADGTPIAYDRTGQGPVLIMVGGAMTTRISGSRPQLASLLADRFTVIDYDRRGRGDSGDTQPYTPQREIEDIEALIDATGPAASLYGHSSGGCLALDAAVQLGPKVSKLAIYEAPYNDDPAVAPLWAQYLEQLAEALAEGRRGDAVAAARRHPLARAMRIDKLSLAALEATLILYRDPERARREIPVLAMLDADQGQLASRAERLRAGVGPRSEILHTVAKVGGGALPLLELEGPAVALPADVNPVAVARALREGDPAVIARISDGRVLLDPRTIADDEVALAARAARSALERSAG